MINPSFVFMTSCRQEAVAICPRPSPLPVGAEAPRAAEQKAT